MPAAFSIARRRPAIALVGTLALFVPAGHAWAGPAAAATCSSSGARDAFAGVPRYDGSRGAVDVRQQGRAPQIVTRSSTGAGAGQPGDAFAAALAHERSGTGCAVLAIGAPGAAGKGAVYLVVDSATGFGKGRATLTVTAPGGAAGDRFGETVLISRSASAGDVDSFELWVGAPRRDVGGAVDAGSIERFRLTRTPGTDALAVTHVASLRQGTSAVPGTSAEPNDRFGEVLAPTERGVVVGVPHENVGSAVDAGMVTLIGYDSGTGRYVGRHNLTQNRTGLAGDAETGDRFGAAVAACGRLIGAPGEDLGSTRDAGMVQVLRGCSTTTVLAGGTLTQESDGVLGAGEAGDRFGAAVGIAETFEDGSSFLVGVPGEDVGRVADAGVVVAEHSCGVPPCGWYTLRQQNGLPGTAEPGDQVGASLHVRHLYGLIEPGVHETGWPVIGASGEDLGSVRDSGAAYGRAVAGGELSDVVYEFAGGPGTGLRFGAVFATDTFGQPAG